MFNSPMFAFADEKLAMRVTSTISWLLVGEEMKWLDVLLGIFICTLPIWVFVFHYLSCKNIEKLTDIAFELDKANSKRNAMFQHIGDLLDETKKTNKILSKLVVKKKTKLNR